MQQTARSAVRREDSEAMKAAFIAKNGVTKCPRPDELVPPMPVELPTHTQRPPAAAAQPSRVPKPPAVRDLGTKPMLMWVPTSELHVDHGYQRSISTRRGEKAVRDIVSHFQWRLFQPVTITQREEAGYWLIDGQHRMTAARQLGIRELPAILHENLTSAEQALAFAGINGKRVAVNAYAIHHAMVAADDPWSAKLAAVCEKAGVSIPRYPKMASLMQPNETLAIAAMKAVIKKAGDDALLWTLTTLRRAYPDEAGTITARAVRYLSAFYVAYSDHYIDKTVLAETLAEADLDQLAGDAAAEDRVGQVNRALAGLYNRLRPGKPLPIHPIAPAGQKEGVREINTMAIGGAT